MGIFSEFLVDYSVMVSSLKMSVVTSKIVPNLSKIPLVECMLRIYFIHQLVNFIFTLELVCKQIWRILEQKKIENNITHSKTASLIYTRIWSLSVCAVTCGEVFTKHSWSMSEKELDIELTILLHNSFLGCCLIVLCTTQTYNICYLCRVWAAQWSCMKSNARTVRFVCGFTHTLSFVYGTIVLRLLEAVIRSLLATYLILKFMFRCMCIMRLYCFRFYFGLNILQIC